eukprot:XP_011669586.1 PREDICTED: neurochondrin [Strongylocentrotus purpuratus]
MSSVPDGCDSHMYKSLAMTLLACFSTDPILAASQQMIDKLPQIMECITMATSASETESTAREDAYQVLIGIASTEIGRKELMKDHRVNVLCDICLKEGQGHDLALKVLLHLLHWSGQEMWQTNPHALNRWIATMATEFQQNQDARKFQLCEKLSAIISTSSWMPEEVPEWGVQIHRGLYDSLRSKLGEAQRDPTLRLVATMLRCFGVDWALGQTGDKRKFFLLLVHLACVETRMTLENTSPQYILSKTSVLLSCYTLLEVSIQYLTCGPSLELDRQQVIQLHSAMTGAFSAVMFYMNSVKDQEEQVTLCALARPWEGLLIGAIGGIIAVFTPSLLEKIKIDDPVGVIGVHALAASWGILSVGLFAQPDDIENLNVRSGLFYGGGWELLGIQALMIVTLIAWTGLTAFILLYAIQNTIGLRCSVVEEILGADIIEHGIDQTSPEDRVNVIRELRSLGEEIPDFLFRESSGYWRRSARTLNPSSTTTVSKEICDIERKSSIYSLSSSAIQRLKNENEGVTFTRRNDLELLKNNGVRVSINGGLTRSSSKKYRGKKSLMPSFTKKKARLRINGARQKPMELDVSRLEIRDRQMTDVIETVVIETANKPSS